jgi:23S rRNA (uridine2552-2'-O)-methyltransferase
LKGAKPSSSRWLQRRNKDPLILQSKLDNYRARSAYKLIEINDKFHLLKSKTTVIDLGARPGSWSQVASNIIGTNKYTLDELASWKHGMILAVDKEEIEDIPGVFIIDRVDITTELAHRKISNFLAGHKVDLVMSDMAPNASGMRLLDHQRIIGLGYAALSVSKLYLKDKGNFICKLWDGSSLNCL